MGMITNGQCTVIRTDGESYFPVWSGECMRQGKDGFKTTKNGEEQHNGTVIFIPDISADIAEGDTIICGECGDLDNAGRHGLTIMSVSRHDYGSADMQHIELEAE